MRFRLNVRWWLAFVILACAAVAHAQTAPPLKPGLWEITQERELDGQPAPDLARHLQNMPPDMRRRMEANLRQQGVELVGSGMKMCMTRESLVEGRWQGEQGACKTDYTRRTSAGWKWRSVCTQPPSETEGVATFSGTERYSVKSTTRTQRQGGARVLKVNMTGKWLSADCGDLKPAQPAKVSPAASAAPKR